MTRPVGGRAPGDPAGCRRCARSSSRCAARSRRPSATTTSTAPPSCATAGCRSSSAGCRPRRSASSEKQGDDAAAARGGHRGRDRRGRRALDRHPGRPADGGRAREAAAPRRGAARARDRPGRGGAARRRRGHPRPRGDQGPAPADRLVHLPRPDRRRARPSSSRALAEALFDSEDNIVRLDMSRVPGAPHGQPADGRAARLRRLRGGRPAHRGGAPQALLGRAVRRDREGARRRLQHAAADPRRRPAHRRAGPHGRLPQHRDHHDLEHRLAVPARRRSPTDGEITPRTRATA